MPDRVRRRRTPARLRSGVRAAAITVAVVALLVLVYGWAVEPRLVMSVQREDVALHDLPAAWVGRTIAATGDFEVGAPGENRAMARRVVRRLVEERPAAVLLIGDFVHPAADHARAMRRLAELLRPLADSGIPAFAVLGGHDLAAGGNRGPAALRATLGRLGVRVLHDQAAAIRPFGGGPPLHLVGIASPTPEAARAALASVPPSSLRVVFMPRTDAFRFLPPGAAPLVVAGLAHPPLVRFPAPAAWPGLGARAGAVPGDGWVQGYGAPGNRLYVNRGVGFSRAPIRINRPPELTLFTLRRAAAKEAPS